MHWHNSKERWGVVSIGLHWLVALTVFGMFLLGSWMVDLTYYDPLYRTAPDLHRSIGLSLLLVLLLRIGWRLLDGVPEPLSSHTMLERAAAHWVHRLLYLLLFALLFSGYLISTADGRSITVFNWFEVPALFQFVEQQEEISGDLHRWIAYSLMGLVAVHAMGAFKHHFIDRDTTLKRMLGID